MDFWTFALVGALLCIFYAIFLHTKSTTDLPKPRRKSFRRESCDTSEEPTPEDCEDRSGKSPTGRIPVTTALALAQSSDQVDGVMGKLRKVSQTQDTPIVDPINTRERI